MKRRAFFLDRDGVINQEVSYLSDPEKMVLLPGVPEAVERMHEAGFLTVVTTNQSGVARGMYTAADTQLVHLRIQRELLSAKIPPLDAFYACFHHPEYGGPCSCRKPAPGMLLQAASELQIDLSRSFMIGDRRSDLLAGKNAGCAASCLVTTGYGEKEQEFARQEGFPVAPDLPGAVELLLRLK